MVSSLWDGPGTERKASVGYCRKLEVLNFSDIIMERRGRKRILGPLPLLSRWEIREMRVIHGQLSYFYRPRLALIFFALSLYTKHANI
jgi:hypothetical protein